MAASLCPEVFSTDCQDKLSVPLTLLPPELRSSDAQFLPFCVPRIELGGHARDMNDEQRNHPGYDLQSIRRTASGASELLFIEVKGRIEGSNTVTVSRNEMLTALNKPDQYILALVRVSIGRTFIR